MSKQNRVILFGITNRIGFWLPLTIALLISYFFSRHAIFGELHMYIFGVIMGFQIKQKCMSYQWRLLPNYPSLQWRTAGLISAIYVLLMPMIFNWLLQNTADVMATYTINIIIFVMAFALVFFLGEWGISISWFFFMFITIFSLAIKKKVQFSVNLEFIYAVSLIMSVIVGWFLSRRILGFHEEKWENRTKLVFSFFSRPEESFAKFYKWQWDWFLDNKKKRLDPTAIPMNVWNLSKKLTQFNTGSNHFYPSWKSCIYTIVISLILIPNLNNANTLFMNTYFIYWMALFMGGYSYFQNNFGYELMRSIDRKIYIKALLTKHVMQNIILGVQLTLIFLFVSLLLNYPLVKQSFIWSFYFYVLASCVGPFLLSSVHRKNNLLRWSLLALLLVSKALLENFVNKVGFDFASVWHETFGVLLVSTLFTWACYKVLCESDFD